MVTICLTPEQIAILERPFRLDEHAFFSGRLYIKKQAIRRRLYEVDPAWTNTESGVMSVDDKAVILRGGLTLCGITRYAYAGGKIKKSDNADTAALNTINAFKGADTDMLARTALAFGVGWYAKELPKDSQGNVTVKDMASLKTYLDSLNSKQETTSQHWAVNGGGQRVQLIREQLGLDVQFVKENVEPGKVLNSLTETTLNEVEFTRRLFELWRRETAVKPAQPKATNGHTDAPPTKGEDKPANPLLDLITCIYVDPALLSAHDVIYIPDGSGLSKRWTIKSISGKETIDGKPTRNAVLSNGKESKDYAFSGIGNIPNTKIVGGPKFDAAKEDRTLVEQNGDKQWVWKREQVEASETT